VLRALGALFVVGALGVTAAAHTLVASDQQRIDNLHGRLTQTLAEQQDLQLTRAELESPVRVLGIAEHQLGMVSSGSVSYLAPVNPGPSVEQAGTAAATSDKTQERNPTAPGSARATRPASSGVPGHSTKTGKSSQAAGRSAAISRTG
jgi:hypothetical protein